MESNDYDDNISKLIADGISEEEARLFDRINEHIETMQAEETVSELVQDDFSANEAQLAIRMSKSDYIPPKQHRNLLKSIAKDNKTLDQLLLMGFEEEISVTALSLCNYDVNSATALIVDHDSFEHAPTLFCGGSVKQCNGVKTIVILNEMNNIKEQMYDDVQLVWIVNAFNHSISVHNCDADFEYISHLMNHSCDNLESCDIVQRHYTSNHNDDDKDDGDEVTHKDLEIDARTSLRQEIFDKIHCHYVHSYDIFRMNQSEQKEIADEAKIAHNDHDDMKGNFVRVDKTIVRLRKKLSHKRNRFRNVIQSTRYDTKNRFCSHIKSNACKIKGKIAHYSYGWNFNYWKHCKQSNFTSINMSHLCASQLYIEPMAKYTHGNLATPMAKYESLKEEVLAQRISKKSHNQFSRISTKYWQKQRQKALLYLKSDECLKRKAQVHTMPNNYSLDEYAGSPYSPARFGYSDGDIMTERHVICIILYCALDDFQYQFSASYRAKDANEDLQQIILRHRHFHHFAKNLREAVEVFGIFYATGDIRKMYHGVDKQMTFNRMTANIYSVMSTTSDFNQALVFADGTGLVLELVPSTTLKYFNCRWLSKYPDESEMLFIGGFASFFFVNITNTLGEIFELYIKALGMIDQMMMGRPFNHDPTKVRKSNRDILNNPWLAIVPMTDKIKRRVALIHKVVMLLLNREQKASLPPYIDGLVDQIFQNKTYIHIHMNTMNVNYMGPNAAGEFGYSFLKPYFCSDQYEGLDLMYIHSLFPSINKIIVSELLSIDSGFLDALLTYLQEYKKGVQMTIELRIQPQYGYMNINEQCANYRQRFARMQYEIHIAGLPCRRPGMQAKLANMTFMLQIVTKKQ
eukprot:49829_1